MSSQTITVPDIGGAEGVEIIEVCVAVGDRVVKEQSLIVLETDKATVEVPSTAEGQITELLVEVGQKISEGDAICSLDSVDTSSEPQPSSEPETPKAPAADKSSTTQPSGEPVVCVVPDGVDEAEVIEVTIKVGDTIAEGDTVATLETDKATVDVPATAAGTVTVINIAVGQKVASGDSVAELVGDSATKASEPAASQSATSSPQGPETAATSESSEGATAQVRQCVVPEGAENAEVIEVLVKVGQDINEGDSLAVLETDKATVEVPASLGGRITSLLINVGDTVSSGDAVAELEFANEQNNTTQAATSREKTTAANRNERTPDQATENNKAALHGPADAFNKATEVYAGPAVRTHARLLGVDLHEVKATGPRGRILKEDVDNFVKQVIASRGKNQPSATLGAEGAGIPPMPSVDFSKFGEIETVAMTKIQKITAFNMHRNWLHIPAVTQFDDADITDLEAFRKSLKTEAESRGVKLTPLPFLLKAVASALKHEPKFNTSLGPDGESLIQKHYIHIGIAADTPAGLVVPVIRNVDQKGLWQLAEEANGLIKKARDGKLTPADMQGGCFTISSLGAMGGKGFTPIVNAPEVGILSVSKAEIKPVWDGKEFQPRNLLPLGLSYDHRVINGADCGRFFTYLVAVLSDVRKLLL